MLVLAPHADDLIGCAGFMAKALEEERHHNVAYIVLADSHSGLIKEALKSVQALGMSMTDVCVYRYPTRQFPAHRQDILEDLVKLQKDLMPDTVLMPSIHDVHQDHRTIHDEGRRAFKNTTVLGYEEAWNNYRWDNTLFVPLTVGQMTAKIKAVQCFVSQSGRPYTKPDFLEAQAKVRGLQIGRKYAESYEVVRWVLSD